MLDIIGTLYDIDNSDPDSPVSTPLAGYHINATRKIKGADAYLVEPLTPRRVFAGIKTYHYTFADEDEVRQVIGYEEEAGYAPEFEPKPVPVPKSVSSRQGMQQLIIAGLDELVESAIDGIGDVTQRKLTRAWFLRATEWERDNPQFIGLMQELGLTDQQADDHMRAAALL